MPPIGHLARDLHPCRRAKGRQDRFGIRGHIPVCSDVPGQCAEINGGGIDVRRTERALSPSLAVSWQATDWLQLFERQWLACQARRVAWRPRVPLGVKPLVPMPPAVTI